MTIEETLARGWRAVHLTRAWLAVNAVDAGFSGFDLSEPDLVWDSLRA